MTLPSLVCFAAGGTGIELKIDAEVEAGDGVGVGIEVGAGVEVGAGGAKGV